MLTLNWGMTDAEALSTAHKIFWACVGRKNDIARAGGDPELLHQLERVLGALSFAQERDESGNLNVEALIAECRRAAVVFCVPAQWEVPALFSLPGRTIETTEAIREFL